MGIAMAIMVATGMGMVGGSHRPFLIAFLSAEKREIFGGLQAPQACLPPSYLYYLITCITSPPERVSGRMPGQGARQRASPPAPPFPNWALDFA